jgi:hypothetical protein
MQMMQLYLSTADVVALTNSYEEMAAKVMELLTKLN